MYIAQLFAKLLKGGEARARLMHMNPKVILHEFRSRPPWWRELAVEEMVRRGCKTDDLMQLAMDDNEPLHRPAAMVLVALLTLDESHEARLRGPEWREHRINMLAKIALAQPHLRNIVEMGMVDLATVEYDRYSEILYPD